MATVTINASSNSGYYESKALSYTNARSGTSIDNPHADWQVGQHVVSFVDYWCYESFIEFDTSTIPDGAPIDSVVLKLYCSDDQSTTNFTLQARTNDYGSSLTTADWVAGANLGAKTLLATFASSGIVEGAYNSFAENGSNFKTALNLSGVTRIIVASDRLAAGTTPTTAEYVDVQGNTDANPPQLVVTYTETFARTVDTTAQIQTTESRAVIATAQIQTTEQRSIAATASIVLPTVRSGQRAAAILLPPLSLRLHTPMPDARPLAGLWFATNQTSLRIVTSVERGYESCQIGFPQRTDTGVIPALLEEPISEYADMGHVLVGDGARALFAGRMAAQPQFIRGEIRAITAQGYWAMLNDGPYFSTDTTVTTTGAVILDMLSQRMPFVRIESARWIDPGVSHAPSEFDSQPAGSSIDSMLKQGDGLGTPWDLQFWLAQDGVITACLLPRLAPDVPDYECDWDDNVSLSYDPMAIVSHLAVRHTDGGATSLTDWQPGLSDGTFRRLNGYERQIILDGGQLTDAGAIAFRDTQQALRSQRQWSGTITVTQGSGFVQSGSRTDDVLPRDIVAGQWVKVRGGGAPLLLIQRSDYDAGMEAAQLTVGQGLTSRSLHRQVIETMQAVNAGRNQVSGAPR